MNISFSTDRILRPLLRLSRCLTYIEFMYLFIGRNLLPGLIFTYIYRYHEFLKVFFRLFSLLISVPAISVLKFSLFQRSLFGTLHLLIFLLVVFFEMIRNGFSLQHHLFSSFILSVILFSKSMERV